MWSALKYKKYIWYPEESKKQDKISNYVWVFLGVGVWVLLHLLFLLMCPLPPNAPLPVSSLCLSNRFVVCLLCLHARHAPTSRNQAKSDIFTLFSDLFIKLSKTHHFLLNISAINCNDIHWFFCDWYIRDKV